MLLYHLFYTNWKLMQIYSEMVTEMDTKKPYGINHVIYNDKNWRFSKRITRGI
jgi:hypothetical protein